MSTQTLARRCQDVREARHLGGGEADCTVILHYVNGAMRWHSHADNRTHVACRIGDQTPQCEDHTNSTTLLKDPPVIDWAPMCADCHEFFHGDREDLVHADGKPIQPELRSAMLLPQPRCPGCGRRLEPGEHLEHKCRQCGREWAQVSEVHPVHNGATYADCDHCKGVAGACVACKAVLAGLP